MFAGGARGRSSHASRGGHAEPYCCNPEAAATLPKRSWSRASPFRYEITTDSGMIYCRQYTILYWTFHEIIMI